MLILKNKKTTILYMVTLFIMMSIFVSCTSETEMVSKTEFKMGTICTISLPYGTADEVFDGCFKVLDDVESSISRTDADSELSLINKNKKGVLDPDTFNLMQSSLDMYRESGGAFNPAIGAAVSLWDIGGDNPRIPSDEELAAVDVDADDILVNIRNSSVSIPSNMEIDLGAVGKGWSANKLRTYLRKEHISNAIINLGGNILLFGKKDNKKNWTIGLQDPNKDTGDSYILLSLSDTSIVTSGTYERFFIEDGVKYHHILSSETLYPAESDIISSTIISKNSTLCDMLSTTCFIMGSEKALEFIKRYDGVSAIFLLKDGSIVTSDNFDFEYEILNENYHMN
jgi:thiamine biosynthesis lipoprotein